MRDWCKLVLGKVKCNIDAGFSTNNNWVGIDIYIEMRMMCAVVKCDTYFGTKGILN
jgi:hypothetical protein